MYRRGWVQFEVLLVTAFQVGARTASVLVDLVFAQGINLSAEAIYQQGKRIAVPLPAFARTV
jgi:hypothetical protein